MLIERRSRFTGKVHTMDLPVTQEQLDHYMASDALIQDAFPNLSASQREFIKTGVTPEEWNAAFPEDEEDDR